MSKSLSVSAVGLVSPCGSLEELFAAYRDKKQLVNVECDISGLEKYFSKKITRRMCRLTSMALLAVCECLADTRYQAPISGRTGLIFATGYGPSGASFRFLDSIIDYGLEMPSPLHFSTSVQNMPAANIALALGLKCPVQTLCQFETSVYAAVKTAELWLESGICDDVLLVGADELTVPLKPCSDIISKLHTLHHRNAVPLSEGSFCLRLTAGSTAESYCRISTTCSEKPSKIFHTGAYNSDYSNAVSNSQIYGNIPVAMGFDMLIAADDCGVTECAVTSSDGNKGSVLIIK